VKRALLVIVLLAVVSSALPEIRRWLREQAEAE
jgi:hypothetical protein